MAASSAFPPPGSFLAAAAKAEEEERNGNVKAAKAIYEQLVGDAATRCPLAHVQLMRFLRRTEGMEAARKAFLAARKARECTFHVYVASAYMELCHNKESKVARNVFQLGMKKFGSEPGFVREFARFLSRLNDGQAMRELLQGALASPSPPPHSATMLWEELVECEQLFGDLNSLREAQEGRRKALASVASPSGAPEPEVEVWREQQDLADRFSYCGLLPCDASALPPNLEAGSAGPKEILARLRSGEDQVREAGQGAAEKAEREAKEEEARSGSGAAVPSAAAARAAAAARTGADTGAGAGSAAAAAAAAAVGAQVAAGVKAEPQESSLPPPLPASVSLSQGIGPAPPSVSSLSAALAAAAAVLMPREGAAGAGGAAAAGAAGAAGAATEGGEEAISRRVKEEAGGGDGPDAVVGDGATAGAGGVKEGGEKGGGEREGAAGATGVKTHQFVASAAVEWKPGSGRKHGIAASSKLLEGLPRSLAHFVSQLPPPVPGPYPDVDFIMSLVIQAELPPEALAAKSGGLHRTAPPGMATGAPGPGGRTGGAMPLAGSKRKEQEEEEIANAEARARNPPPVRDIFRLRQLQRARAGSSVTGSLSGGAGGTGGGTASGSDRFSGGSM
ncbi:unnamed protein product [Closterium sp. Naga37s-1]|nr:unnamed protein product [Closterium sp. Naga37s-1]